MYKLKVYCLIIYQDAYVIRFSDKMPYFPFFDDKFYVTREKNLKGIYISLFFPKVFGYGNTPYNSAFSFEFRLPGKLADLSRIVIYRAKILILFIICTESDIKL